MRGKKFLELADKMGDLPTSMLAVPSLYPIEMDVHFDMTNVVEKLVKPGKYDHYLVYLRK